jgi:Fe-S cluster assembly ATPase SufC
LKNLNLKIKKGEFVCIIGDVGSGKSSLLSALIGDLLYIKQEEYN